MLEGANRQKDVGKQELRKMRPFLKRREFFGGLAVAWRCPCPGPTEKSVGVGRRQNILWNLAPRTLQSLPRGSEASGAGPACSSVNAPQPCRTWRRCCTEHLNLSWLKGLRVDWESSTARHSRTQWFTLFLLIISNFSLASYFRAKGWRGISDIIALGMYFGRTEEKMLH